MTKPVRSTEIVLGRILGFTAVGTLLLAVMGGLSHQFVRRGIQHAHKSNRSVGMARAQQPATTRHAHRFEMLPGESVGVTDAVRGHTT